LPQRNHNARQRWHAAGLRNEISQMACRWHGATGMIGEGFSFTLR